MNDTVRNVYFRRLNACRHDAERRRQIVEEMLLELNNAEDTEKQHLTRVLMNEDRLSGGR